MLKEEDLLPDAEGRRPTTWWSRQKTYYLVIKAEDLLPGAQDRRLIQLLPGAQSRRLIAWCSRQKTYYLVIKEEDLLPDAQGRRLITWWSRQKTYYLMLKAEDLLPGDQGRRPITWCPRQKTYYLVIKAETLLKCDQGRKPITWWSRLKTYYLVIKAEDLSPGDQGRRPITWWSRQKIYCLVIKAKDLLLGDQGKRPITWWSRQKTYYMMIKTEDLLPGDQGSRFIAWWSRKKTYCPPCNRLHSPWSSWCFRMWPPWSRHHLWMVCTQRASHRHRHPETTSPPLDHTAELERHGSWNPEVLAPRSQESQQACELTPADQASEWKSVTCCAESASSSATQSVVPTGMGHNTCTSSSWLSWPLAAETPQVSILSYSRHSSLNQQGCALWSSNLKWKSISVAYKNWQTISNPTKLAKEYISTHFQAHLLTKCTHSDLNLTTDTKTEATDLGFPAVRLCNT